MKTLPQTHPEGPPLAVHRSWRTFILAIAGILLLTLYPFRLASHRHLAGATSAFLLSGWGKGTIPLDGFLNVLLFVPFGFGLAGLLRKPGKSPIGIAASVLIAGALFSYTIEFLQFFIPGRDSGWEDVLTNSLGALVGSMVFQLCGGPVLRFAEYCEEGIGRFATPGAVSIVLLVYFGGWFALSAHLQKEMGFGNWNADALLAVGNSASGRNGIAWSGKVYELEFWDHALSDEAARKWTSSDKSGTFDSGALAAYEFSDSPPFHDRHHLLPDLEWALPGPRPLDPVNAVEGAGSWVATRTPISALVAHIQKTAQFSLHIRFQPDEMQEAPIVSISQPGGQTDMEIRQEGAYLALLFRNRVSSHHPSLAWDIPAVFTAKELRDLLFSYDNSKASIMIDGGVLHGAYRLGPATALAQSVRRVRAMESRGYQYVFYSMVFFPAGCLLGIAWRRVTRVSGGLFLSALALGPPIVLEIILVHVGRQAPSTRDIVLAMALVVGGILWVNTGRNLLRAPTLSTPQTVG